MMDKDTVQYIITYFSSLLTNEENMAIKHTHSLFKLGYRDANPSLNDKIAQLYKKHGWLTEDQSVLDLLKDGYDSFELRTAKRILTQYPDQVFFNYCPDCNKLARTPDAKQCRYCGLDWHTTSDILIQNLRNLTNDVLRLGERHTWNKIPAQCKYILSEIKPSSFSDLEAQREFYKKENLKKTPSDLASIVPKLEGYYDQIYDINMEIFRVVKDYTIIDIRYFLKTSVDTEYYKKIEQNTPMYHAEMTIPPYILDASKQKFDVNWQFNKLKYLWNMFKARFLGLIL